DHAGGNVAGQGADVLELALLGGPEHDGGGGALAADVVRVGAEVRYGDVVDGAVAVDQVDLHHRAFRHVQIGIDLVADLAVLADEHQLAVGDAGLESEGHVRPVGGWRRAVIVLGEGRVQGGSAQQEYRSGFMQYGGLHRYHLFLQRNSYFTWLRYLSRRSLFTAMLPLNSSAACFASARFLAAPTWMTAPMPSGTSGSHLWMYPPSC